MLRNELPDALDIPTGLGKTSVMAIWLVARACGARLPRRLVYVVDRRAVVDQATEIALFTGQQRSDAITEQMLKAIKELWCEKEQELVNDPFGLLAPLGGSSFKFDPRKSWTGIDAGYSPERLHLLSKCSPRLDSSTRGRTNSIRARYEAAAG